MLSLFYENKSNKLYNKKIPTFLCWDFNFIVKKDY